MHKANRGLCFALICIMMLSLVPFSVCANQIEADRECGIEILYSYMSEPLSNAEFYVYRIGEVDEDGTYCLTGKFAEYPLDDTHLNIGASDLSELLYTYALMDRVQPDSVMTVNQHGSSRMTLPVGLYLLAGQLFEDDRGIFTTEPVILALPFRFSSDDSWEYNVIVNPKCRFIPNADLDEINRSVMKVWNGDSESQRPDSIEVYLLQDREVVDTVVLNAENRWSHQWKDLPEGHEWRVAEKPVTGYTVESDLILGIFLITNTYQETEPTDPTGPSDPTRPSDPTDPSDPTGPSDPTSSSDPTEETKPTKPTEPEKPKLPQTGQTWWPVPVLFLLGLLFVVAGLRMRRGMRDET